MLYSKLSASVLYFSTSYHFEENIRKNTLPRPAEALQMDKVLHYRKTFIEVKETVPNLRAKSAPASLRKAEEDFQWQTQRRRLERLWFGEEIFVFGVILYSVWFALYIDFLNKVF